MSGPRRLALSAAGGLADTVGRRVLPLIAALVVGAAAIAVAASIFLVVGRAQRSVDTEPARSPVPSEA